IGLKKWAWKSAHAACQRVVVPGLVRAEVLPPVDFPIGAHGGRRALACAQIVVAACPVILDHLFGPPAVARPVVGVAQWVRFPIQALAAALNTVAGGPYRRARRQRFDQRLERGAVVLAWVGEQPRLG